MKGYRDYSGLTQIINIAAQDNFLNYGGNMIGNCEVCGKVKEIYMDMEDAGIMKCNDCEKKED